MTEPEYESCPTCGNSMDWWETCWSCAGDGGFHDCGEDCCPCLYPELDLNQPCDVCDGRGGYYLCPSAGRHPKLEARP